MFPGINAIMQLTFVEKRDPRASIGSSVMRITYEEKRALLEKTKQLNKLFLTPSILGDGGCQKMKLIYLFGALISFVLSFIVHRFFLQFLVFGIILVVLYVIEKNSYDVSELKKTIEKHNELIKNDIEELKRQ